ncbi:hypothetical protein GQ53DRAFT_744767 [Thozetella sp. PMI_491]|nr:hypothetical protein GQ53DRAFT_744767 [Thozetella sp. PMI_491]
MSVDDPRLPAVDPVPLTRDSLHQLELEQMRLCGEPSDGSPRYIPSRSDDSKTPSEGSTKELYPARAPRGMPQIARGDVLGQLRGSKPKAQEKPSLEQDSLKYDHDSPLPESSSSQAWFGYSRQNSKEPWRKSVYDRENEEYGKESTRSGDAIDGSISTNGKVLPTPEEVPNREQAFPRDRSDQGSSSRVHEPSTNAARPPRIEPYTGLNHAQFPLHHAVDSITELSNYLAASDYIISLGGPRQPDTRYGIIIVPAGEEQLLFSARPNIGASSEALVPNLDSSTPLEEKGKNAEEAVENDAIAASSIKLEEALSENASTEQPVVVQARQTLDSLLAQKPKPKRLRSLAKSIFDRPKKLTNDEKAIDDDTIRRSLLLEIARVAASLATEETTENSTKDPYARAEKD